MIALADWIPWNLVILGALFAFAIVCEAPRVRYLTPPRWLK